MKIPFNGSLIMHATCVDINGSGVLIVGRSGSGKSSLAINLLALGSTLVADDQCELVKKIIDFAFLNQLHYQIVLK